jgi:large subunit ribosomal protein L21
LLDVDRLPVETGSTVELPVLLIGGNGEVSLGTPALDGARVVAEVVEHGRDKKIRVFKYKNKTRYRRRFGHRQQFTRLAIREILTPGQEPRPEDAEEEKKPARAAARRKAAQPKAPEAQPAAAAEPAAGAAPAEARPKARRAPRAKPAAPEIQDEGAAVTQAEQATETGEKPAKAAGSRRRKKETEGE